MNVMVAALITIVRMMFWHGVLSAAVRNCVALYGCGAPPRPPVSTCTPYALLHMATSLCAASLSGLVRLPGQPRAPEVEAPQHPPPTGGEGTEAE